MEAALARIAKDRASAIASEHDHDHDDYSIKKVEEAFQNLRKALEAVIPILNSQYEKQQQQHEEEEAEDDEEKRSPLIEEYDDDRSVVITFDWLVNLCKVVPSELGANYLAKSIWEVAMEHTTDEAHAQAALFDVLGASEQSIQVLMEVAPHLSEIAAIPAMSISTSMANDNRNQQHHQDHLANATTVDLENERRQLLLRDAMDAAEAAAIAQAQVSGGGGLSASGMTHTVARASDKKAMKQAEKAAKRAAQALQRAKDAGAIIDDADMMSIDPSSSSYGMMGTGGLMNRSPEELAAMQQSLLPEGSRQYYDDRGLPHGTIRESSDGMEKVIIPARQRDESKLTPRLVLDNVMKVGSDVRRAFDGVKTLNPMQSEVFPVAYQSRENILLCAPTGAGKTNVAMLTVVAHFRDVGLLLSSDDDNDNYYNDDENEMETGKKVVYIAPMKALAQEVVEKFSSKLKPLGLIVRELTGDMQLSRAEAQSANVIVTTPEKWDVVTRKSGTDELSLGNQCGLLIIDEVHLLADERGAVIESVVARLHRLVESRQRQVRIVALSATLPNYRDVADFLQVSKRGLFFFGPEHRPVPLQQQLIGVSVNARDLKSKESRLNEVCFDVVIDSLRRGYQVMVFVHTRKGTGTTAEGLAEIALQENVLERFFITQGKDGPNGDAYSRYVDRVKKSRNAEVRRHYENGIGIHHAGMLRGDRKLSEQMFNDGAIKVLCCTATLAWGVNLPAHTVVIKGTEVYNPEKGGIVDLSILDVQQIFGRAGRPQFDTSGEATLITLHESFNRYIDKLVRAVPIESNFIKQLPDHLNAEVVGGTVTNIPEALAWLRYTYLYVRMLQNPIAYGITADEMADDPSLQKRCRELVTNAARLLSSNEMLRYHIDTGNLSVARNGTVAAHFYLQAESIETFKDMLGPMEAPNDADLCRVICAANEFSQLRLRQEELDELQSLARRECPLPIKGAGADDAGTGLVTDARDKAFVLLQAHISRAKIKSFTLISDMNYISSNAGRVTRALFEMLKETGDGDATLRLIRIAKSVENQIWWFLSPLRHFESEIRPAAFSHLEKKTAKGSMQYDTLHSVLSLLDMNAGEVGELCRWNADGGRLLLRHIRLIPTVNVSCNVQPITTSILRFQIQVEADFRWDGRWHGGAQSYWLFVQDGASNRIYHHEHFTFSKKTYTDGNTFELPIPAFSPLPSQYYVRVVSDSWVGLEILLPVSLVDIKLPSEAVRHTDLLDLTPLPVSALQDPNYEQLYTKFTTFNPIQTQLFHVLYHTNVPVLLGAPTGSGKTIVAEIAMFRMRRQHPKGICVYIAPLKALARERLKEWVKRLGAPPLKWNVLELSGDTHHDRGVLERADVLVCTPEKWDLISRGWRGSVEGNTDSNVTNGREFVRRVRLLVLDEVHLLGEERGAVLEAIVSRTRFVSMHVQAQAKNHGNGRGQEEATRIIGLSTALANAGDLANWIGIDTEGYGPKANRGLYNFKPSVRPVPTVVHVSGYPGKHYCPRMATMNKPCFASIKELSPSKPVLIFVASRRQTRLTAFDLISYAAADENPRRFLSCSELEIEAIAERLDDEALRHTITFGIGIHHAGLSSSDRETVETMFLQRQIQVLVATATLAWGVNLPAFMVIVKGTEYYDGKTSRYVDYPLTDVLQMIGRAGRPGFDTEAKAVVMVAADKKNFYKRFLYSPFPVESNLSKRLPETLNAEIAGGTIRRMVDAVGYMEWTFFARRLKANPSYYGAESESEEHIQACIMSLVKETLAKLHDAGCMHYESDAEDFDSEVQPSTLGLACSHYYLAYRTPKQMQTGIRQARKLIMSGSEQELMQCEGLAGAGGGELRLNPFSRPLKVDELSIAWILYVLCSTHEFDELPVRHNEEILNEELSDDLMWGPDTSSLLAGGISGYVDPSIYEDPHTKCFLLVQAYMEKAKLPVSDYVNDTQSVVDNLPRLLAGMTFIATKENTTTGSFEVLTQLVRTKQVLEARCTVDADPLLQLPGFSSELVRRLQSSTKGRKNSGPDTLVGLRSLPRNEAFSLLQRIKGNNKNLTSIDHTLDVLYGMPKIGLISYALSNSGPMRGTLKVNLQIERMKSQSKKSNSGPSKEAKPLSATLLLGNLKQRILLSSTSIPISRFGSWNVELELSFDGSGGDGADVEGGLIFRLVLDGVRGLDSEVVLGR